MQPRAILRIVGRLLVFGFIAMLAMDTYINRQPTHVLYMQKYDNFRNMLYFKRILDLPPARYIEGLLDYFYWIDFYYLIVMGLLVLFITKVGGSMMVLYYCLKLAIWYLPFAVQAHKISFTSRDTMDLIKLITFLGLSMALTASPQTDKNAEQKQDLRKKKQE